MRLWKDLVEIYHSKISIFIVRTITHTHFGEDRLGNSPQGVRYIACCKVTIRAKTSQLVAFLNWRFICHVFQNEIAFFLCHDIRFFLVTFQRHDSCVTISVMIHENVQKRTHTHFVFVFR